jgi:hypothetical protein
MQYLWTFHTCQCNPKPEAYDDGSDIPRCTVCQMLWRAPKRAEAREEQREPNYRREYGGMRRKVA